MKRLYARFVLWLIRPALVLAQRAGEITSSRIKVSQTAGGSLYVASDRSSTIRQSVSRE